MEDKIGMQYNTTPFPPDLVTTAVTEHQKKARATQQIIALLGDLELQSQVSVMRAVAEFFDIAEDVGR